MTPPSGPGHLFLALLVAFGAVGAGSPETDEQLVSIGPAAPLGAQLAYLRTTWPDHHAVAVVAASGDPSCGQPPETADAETWYCDLPVVARELLLLRWREGSLPGPGSHFTVHYWHRGPEAPLRIDAGAELLVMLAPTHVPNTFVATVLAAASPGLLERVRSVAGDPSP